MAYRNPFLESLKGIKEEGLANEARTINAANMMSQVPLTLDKLMKEEEARKQKLKQQGFENEVTLRREDRSDAQEKRTTENENRRFSNIDRTYFSNRGGDLISNTVGGLLGTIGQTEAPNQEVPPVANQAPPPEVKPSPIAGSIADPSVFAKATGIQAPVPNAPIVEEPKPVSGGQGTAVPMPEPKTGGIEAIKMSVFSKNPELKAVYDEAINRLNKYPEFKDHYREEDVLGEIVKQYNERMQLDEKNSLARDRLDEQKRVNDARIKRLERLSKPAGIKPKKEWPVSLTPKQQAELADGETTIYRMNIAADKLINNKFDPGFIEGVENWIRTKLRMRTQLDAEGYASLKRELNTVIHRLAGATVTDQELDRIMGSMPSEFDDKDTLAAFIDAIRQETVFRMENIYSYADLGKRSDVPMIDRIGGGIDPKTGKPKKKPAGSGNTSNEDIKKKVSEMTDEELEARAAQLRGKR